MTMITPSYLGETIEYSSLHACRSTLEDPTKNGGYRANRDASAAVDAFHRVDIKLRDAFEAGLILARVNTVHRANVHARGILGAGARFGDYISHSKSPLKRNTGEQRGRLINRKMSL